jgi:hypothetical protein
MASFYVTLTNDAESHFQATNTPGHFRAHLAQPYRFNGEWEVGLAEAHIPPQDVSSTSDMVVISGGGGEEMIFSKVESLDKKPSDLLNIECDLVEEQQINHKTHRFLRTINIKRDKNTKENTKTYTFNNIYYYKVSRTHITDIKIYITDDAGDELAFTSNKLSILLHFRQRRGEPIA